MRNGYLVEVQEEVGRVEVEVRHLAYLQIDKYHSNCLHLHLMEIQKLHCIKVMVQCSENHLRHFLEIILIINIININIINPFRDSEIKMLR